jgi:O-acetylhomoserine/O-acetylserine sulfhydrylase-like pyridoxal-dependent enzyme
MAHRMMNFATEQLHAETHPDSAPLSLADCPFHDTAHFLYEATVLIPQLEREEERILRRMGNEYVTFMHAAARDILADATTDSGSSNDL